ncbi:DNA-binding response OmpR family regulator [Thioclava sp. ES.031]|uniref:response regulator transcription factor n=1 Tax=Thioclava sp. ES.031 TaxID=1798203 RepID=UPI000C002501|nr:winged helix-turn-helix domain-containing protein [Thioclava sp. ES.031]PFG61870.1 DNA-binding response OmpR family regulator [Thioclava sp. ES.031]
MFGADAMRRQNVIIVAEDEAKQGQLAGFFRECCGWDPLPFAKAFEAEQYILLHGSPRLLLINLAEPEGAADLIRTARGSEMESLVLFVDPTTGGELAAEMILAGADDVLREPYSERELAARLWLRAGSSLPISFPGEEKRVARLKIDKENRLTGPDAAEAVQLTPMEGEIMCELIRSGGRIVTRDALSRRIDKCMWVYGDRKFDVHITKIRKKLRGAFGERYVVETIRAAGYSFYEIPQGRQQADAT